jgi:hypothetical protein
MWAIVILLGLILLMQFQINSEMEKANGRLYEISSAAELYKREARAERKGLPSEEELRQQRKETEEWREQDKRNRAAIRRKVEEEWGGWGKARLVCLRRQGDIGFECVMSTSDRAYTAKGLLSPDEAEQLQLNAEIQYAISPIRSEVYLPSPSRSVSRLDLVEEKLSEPLTTPFSA